MPFTFAILASILLQTWVIDQRFPRSPAYVTIGAVAALGLWHSARTGEWGLDRRAFAPALRAVALFTTPAVTAIPCRVVDGHAARSA